MTPLSKDEQIFWLICQAAEFSLAEYLQMIGRIDEKKNGKNN